MEQIANNSLSKFKQLPSLDGREGNIWTEKLCVEDQVFIISIVESVEQSSAIKTHFGGKDWELIDFSCSSKNLSPLQVAKTTSYSFTKFLDPT